MAYVRTVKTASGATAAQIVYSSRRGSRDIEHVGSAHDDAELEALKAAARQRMAAGQPELDLGLAVAAGGAGGGPLAITSARMGHLWEALAGGLVLPPPVMRCLRRWGWRGSSSRPASWTACGCWARRVSPHRRIGR